MLRVADMRFVLDSQMTALVLYEQLQSILRDEQFGEWLTMTRSAVISNAKGLLNDYKTGVFAFTPSPRWNPGVATASTFPSHRFEPAKLERLREEWTSVLGENASDAIMQKYLNMHCLATNEMENSVVFQSFVRTKLIVVGFNKMESIGPESIIGGEVRDPSDELSVLRDTHETLQLLFALSKTNPPTLSIETICYLHKTLMQTSRVLHSHPPQGHPRLKYMNIGVTRQTSCVNVTATSTSPETKSVTRIQFCPYDEVDAELEKFCQGFNSLIQRTDVDPFASAAWIHYVFVTIHPFEDGNGRLSRILASIPLINNQPPLPPICVPSSGKQAYIDCLNAVRENRGTNYMKLMNCLFNETDSSVALLYFVLAVEKTGQF